MTKFHQQLALFLHKKRGTLTYAQFSRKLGVSLATLQRLEQGRQNVTLKTLAQMASRLKCRMGEMFE